MRWLLSSFILIVWSSFTVLSQSNSDWEIIVYDSSAGKLLQITPENTTELPIASPILASGGNIYSTIAASFDGHYIAYMDTELNIQIIDTITGECCQTAPNPYKDNMPAFDQVGLDVVNPDGTAVVISTVILNSAVEGPYFLGELQVTTTDGDVIRLEDICKPFFGVWQDEGIEIIQNCNQLDGYLAGDYEIWNPESGWLSQTTTRLSYRGDQLAITDEIIVLGGNQNYPHNRDDNPYEPLANALIYRQSADESGVEVFISPDDTYLSRPHWVADGQAVLLLTYMEQQVDLVYRNGSHQIITFDNEVDFVAGTPDGWVVQDTVTGEFLHYIIAENHEITFNALGHVSTDYYNRVVKYPLLGASIENSGFSSVPQILATVTPTSCGNGLMFRLRNRRQATVLPGGANNIRSEPTTSSDLIGQIPEGATFNLLDGPVCAQEMAWWKVDYDGAIGWTAEGQGDTYWLEPFMG